MNENGSNEGHLIGRVRQKRFLSLFVLAHFLSGGCLALAVVSVVLDHANRTLQGQLQQQSSGVREELQRVSSVENLSQNILTDLGNAAVSNVEIRVLLARHGYSLSNSTNAPKISTTELEKGLDRVQASSMVGPRIPVQEIKP